MKKGLTALIISFMIVINIVPAYAADASLTWESSAVELREDGTHLAFRPANNYISEQNPPTFQWTYVSGNTGYDIIVCSDPELTDIKYHKEGVKYNYYNFDCTFETGSDYYWAVRYNLGGKKSEWSKPIKFRINPNAYEYPVEPVEEMIKKVPREHPRVLITKENKEKLIKHKDTDEDAAKVYKNLITKVEKYVSDGVLYDDPVRPASFASTYEKSVYDQNLVKEAAAMYDIATTCGFAYQLSGDKKYGEFGKKALIKLSEWDVEGATSYANQTQVNRAIAYNAAMAYDWLYEIMSEKEIKKVLDMITARTSYIEHIHEDLMKIPYNSMGWTIYGFTGIIYYAAAFDVPGYEERLKDNIVGFTALLSPWSYQDGGSAQGIGYWLSTPSPQHEFMMVLAMSNVHNMFLSAWERNMPNFQLYAYPHGSWGSFGDGGMVYKANNYFIAPLAINSYFTKNPMAKWLQNQFGPVYLGTGQDINEIDLFIASLSSEVKPKEPTDYPLAREIKDQGLVVMTDSLVNPDRIQLSFHSSQYGSYNHSNADQNAFYIQAYGEKLAVKGGYYDTFLSAQHAGFARTSPAHNTVTVATSKGQKDGSILAKGKIINFINQADFDLATGDATPAYAGKLDKFERHIVYIRPDTFVVIDDLDAKGDEKSSFEWWLNAESDISLYEDSNGARLKEGAAVLDASVKYPKNVNKYYNNIHAASDMIKYTPEGAFAQKNVQRRVWFETEKVDKTKMIVTMDIHRDTEAAQNVDTVYYDKYMKMTFEDGTVMLVNLSSDDEEIVTDNISFVGDAVVYNDESVMLVSGTELSMYGSEIIKAKNKLSVALGKNELCLSTEEEENVVFISEENDYVKGLDDIKTYDGYEIGKAWGIECKESPEPEDEYLNFDKSKCFAVSNGRYTLFLNGKHKETEELSGNVKISVNGDVKDYPMTGRKVRNGVETYNLNAEIPLGNYRVVSKNPEMVFGGYAADENRHLMKTVNITSSVKDNFVELEGEYMTEVIPETLENDEAIKGAASAFTEAEYPVELAEGVDVYTSRSFLSNGTGVSLFNGIGTKHVYNMTVTEAGDYDICVKYVAFEEGDTIRSFTINGEKYVAVLEKTAGYGSEASQWRVARLGVKVHLEPGTYPLEVEPMGGKWNIDWFSLNK